MLHSLCEYEFIKPHVHDIFSLGTHFQSPTEDLVLEKSAFTQFVYVYNRLILALSSMSDMSEHFFQKDEENQLNIKLPDEISLEEMAALIKDIDLVFNKMKTLRKLNENNDYTLKRVDAGSVWLIIGVSVALPGIGMLVKLGMDVKRRMLEDDMMKQKLRALKSGAAVIEEMEGTIKTACVEMAKQLSEEQVWGFEPEYLSDLAKTIEIIGNMHYKRVEFYASLEAPDSVAGAFPKQEFVPKLKLPKLQLPPSKSEEEQE